MDFYFYFVPFFATISALSSSSYNLKSYSVKNSSITQYSPGGQVEVFNSSLNEVSCIFWLIGFKTCFVGSPFSWCENISFNTFAIDLLLAGEFLSNWFQNSTDFTLVEILDVLDINDKVLDFIEAYDADDDLDVTDPDDEFDDKVEDE